MSTTGGLVTCIVVYFCYLKWDILSGTLSSLTLATTRLCGTSWTFDWLLNWLVQTAGSAVGPSGRAVRHSSPGYQVLYRYWEIIKSSPNRSFSQSWWSVTFWCGSGSGSADPYLWLMGPDPDPTPDPTPFVSDSKNKKKNPFFSYNLPAGTLSSVLKIFFLLNFCFKILFCKHFFSPLNIFMRKGKDPDP